MNWDFTYMFFNPKTSHHEIAHKIITAPDESTASLEFMDCYLEDALFVCIIKIESIKNEG